MNAAKAAVRHEDNQVSGFFLFDDRRHDVVDRRGRPRTLTRAFEVAHELLSGQPLGLRQTRAEHGCNDDLVGRSKRAGEVLLEDAKLRGDRLTFKLAGRKGEFSGQVKGRQIEGTVENGGAKSPWSATLGG